MSAMRKSAWRNGVMSRGVSENNGVAHQRKWHHQRMPAAIINNNGIAIIMRVASSQRKWRNQIA